MCETEKNLSLLFETAEAMKIILYFLISLWLIFLGVILGDYGSWYFAWLVGTVMIVLISAAGGALMDTQLEEEQQQK